MSIFVSGPPGQTIEKTMSLTLAEFEKSLARITADSDKVKVAPGHYVLALETGRVTLDVSVLEPMLMGGLVKLPRCKVILRFEDVPTEQRLTFLNRFDQAFQRGGG